MKKVTKLILMLCLILSGAFCYASGAARTENERGINMDSSLNKALGFSVNVTPNPAITWVTIDYTLPMKTAKATLTMTNTIGTNVLSTELEGIQGSKVLDLRGLAAGVYMYTIRCGQYVENGKLVIAK